MTAYDSVKRSDVPALPRGWTREEVPRSSGGINNGRRCDVYYLSPTGVRIRSKPELIKHLGDHYDLSTFDYQTGKVISYLNKGGSNHNSSGGIPNIPTNSSNTSSKRSNKQYDFARGLRSDASLVPPIRQTASIFKQPVTVYKLQSNHGKVKSDFKQNNSEKPKQLFWEKRLSGLRASYPEEIYEPFSLPSSLKPVGPGVGNDIVLASIATILHLGNGAIDGQPVSKLPNLEKNAAVYLNPDQPLIGGITVSQADLEKQEEKVDAARKDLEEALNALTE